MGGAIGAVLAAGNVYTGLKISIIDGGSITAALLGFMFFATFTRLGRRPYSALENNITQTTAASAAIMGYVAGVGRPGPGHGAPGPSIPGWALCVWGLAVALVGIVAAALLRRKLVVDEALPFPTGNATGDLIETIFAARASARSPGAVPDRGRGGGGGRDLVPRRAAAASSPTAPRSAARSAASRWGRSPWG